MSAVSVPELTSGRPSEGGHWYARDGSAVYEIRGANGNMRAVTLRDARKLGLVPGFSSIAKMEHQPALERWKIEQALMAALTLPRFDHETDQDFMARARDDSYAQARKAADRGTQIHTAIQGYYENKPVASDDLPFVMPVVRWLEAFYPSAAWVAEKSFAHPLGYGGKSDLWCPAAVVDVKCKDFDGETKRLAYDEHCMQLTSYAHGFATPQCAKVNIFVSTKVPGLIVPIEWPMEDCVTAWEAFRCLLKLWQLRRGYDSSFSIAGQAA